jgi:cytochrome o ubiquinol oxidase subunit 1
MIIGGVVFGVFAGVNYWFPKFAGFRLNERLGKYAFWCWIIGFLAAFMPLYVLGIMGATRRTDNYAAENGWQGLFVIAGIGVMIIGLGVAFMILQLVVSFFQRKQLRDKTGDPWDGRTLEWSTTSMPPIYNFAVVPQVSSRDAFWEAKQSKQNVKVRYEDIVLPKNSGAGLMIAIAAGVTGFAIVWHIWWLAIVAFTIGAIILIARLTNDDTEYVLTAKEVEVIENARTRKSKVRHA